MKRAGLQERQTLNRKPLTLNRQGRKKNSPLDNQLNNKNIPTRSAVKKNASFDGSLEVIADTPLLIKQADQAADRIEYDLVPVELPFGRAQEEHHTMRLIYAEQEAAARAGTVADEKREISPLKPVDAVNVKPKAPTIHTIESGIAPMVSRQPVKRIKLNLFEAQEGVIEVVQAATTNDRQYMPTDLIAVDRPPEKSIATASAPDPTETIECETLTPIPAEPSEAIMPSEPRLELDIDALSNEAVEAATVPQVEESNLIETADATLLTDEFEESKLEGFEDIKWQIPELQELPEAQMEVQMIEPVGPEAPAAVIELPAPVEEVESVLTRMTEVLETSVSDKSEEVQQIIEDIIVLPDKLQAAGKTEEVIELQLEELFIQLFEAADIEYTPELVKSFVKLTQAHYLEELLQTIEEKGDKVEELPAEIGTREFLQKLRRGLGRIKQAAIHFYEIGKSALHLYMSRTALAPS